MPRNVPSPEVGRNRIVAAANYDPCPIGRSLRVMAVDQGSDPRRLAIDIAIMSAIANAGIDQSSSVEAERSGRSGHYPRLRRKTIERITILAVCNENIHVGRIHGAELGSISSGNGPSQSSWRELSAVFDRLPPSKSRGSIEDEVVFSIDGHAFSLFGSVGAL